MKGTRFATDRIRSVDRDARGTHSTRAADRHPDWCARGHHCTAEGNGHHASTPETWDAPAARVVATRRLNPRTGRGSLEVRLVIALPGDEDQAQGLSRRLIVAFYSAAVKVLRQSA